MEKTFRACLPSIADIIFLAVFIILSSIVGKGLLADADTGYHIRAGEFIIETMTVPKHDVFSFRSPSLPWTAHEWLSEVIMGLIHKSFGLTGIVIFFSFAIASVYFVLFKIVQTTKGNILSSILIVSLVTAASMVHWLARPHIFSLLLTMVWYHLLDTYQHDKGNYLYFLPPLMLLWVNLHAGFIVGFVLLGVYLSGNLFGSVAASEAQKKKRRCMVLVLTLTLTVCLLASLVNPYGYKILLFPFSLVSNRYIMDHVVEFQSPDFHAVMPFRYLVYATLAILGISRGRLNPIELMLILLFTHMALYSARYILLFAIIAAPILVRQTERIVSKTEGKWMDFLKIRSKNIALLDASAKGYVWPTMAILVVCVLAAKGKIAYGFDKRIKPVAAVEFMKREDLKGHMFNNDEFGDYIIYATWPKYKVFLDGRSDMYGSVKVEEYFKVAWLRPDWEKVIEKYNINWIIYNTKSALSTFLLASKEWRLIYSDRVANIFVKNTLDNQPIITRYPDIKPTLEENETTESN
ncbi:MAG: hypothetical protein ACE5HC_14685 [Candidatus Binatia bacterium]